MHQNLEKLIKAIIRERRCLKNVISVSLNDDSKAIKRIPESFYYVYTFFNQTSDSHCCSEQ